MVAANGNAKPKDEAEAEVQPPAYGGPSGDKDVPIRDGFYILMNKMSRTVLDLCTFLIYNGFLSPVLMQSPRCFQGTQSRGPSAKDGASTPLGTNYGLSRKAPTKTPIP